MEGIGHAAASDGPAPLLVSGVVPFLALLFGATALAYGGIFVRQSELPPTASAVYRVAFAVPFLFACGLTQRAPAPRVSQREWWRGRARLLAVGVIFSGNLALYHWSIALTTLANSALLANLAPLFVVLGSWLVFGKRISAPFALSLAVALTGALMLIGARADLGATHILGGVLGMATAIFYGAYLLAVNRVRARFDTVTVMAWSSIGTFLVLLPIAMALGESVVPRTGHGVLILLALALISHVGGQGAIAYALAHLPATVSSVTLLVQPVMAAAFGWMAFQEYPRPVEFVGGAVVLMGIVMARRNPQ
ncbi:MAG: DMT family transporter [Candidatus Rokuibacteriota bacterium]